MGKATIPGSSPISGKNTRQYPAHPLPGVGALIFASDGPSDVAGATEARGPILLVERAGEPLKGFWSLPGGLVETGETLAQAIEREVLEETGLRVKARSLFGLFERIIQDDEGRAQYHYLLADYVCEVVGGIEQAADDVSRIAWVPRSELDQYLLTDGTREVIEQAYDRVEDAPLAHATILSLTGTDVSPRSVDDHQDSGAPDV